MWTAVAALAVPVRLCAQTQQSLPGAAVSAAANRTYDAVVQGMSCKQQPSGRMDCDYKVGKSLRFSVSGVGQQDVVINFLKVDSDEDFVASIAPLHGCIVVRATHTRSDSTTSLAFVSPQDGKIYRNWNTCAVKKGRD
jgi:hypothetical protein